MDQPRSSWQSPQHWPPPSHSIEVENRLVRSELKLEDHEGRLDRHSSRLTWHERALQALALVLWVVVEGSAQGKVPDIAELLLSLLRGAK